MGIRPGITISIQDTDDNFWAQEIIMYDGRFREEISLEQLYQLFKERYEEETGVEDDEDDESTESEGAV